MHIDACDVHAIRVCMLKLFSCRSKATPHPNNPRACKLHEQPKRRHVGHLEGCEFRVCGNVARQGLSTFATKEAVPSNFSGPEP